MLGINFGVFDDEKSFKTSFVTIKPSHVPFFAIFAISGHFLSFLVGQIMVLLGINLAFLGTRNRLKQVLGSINNHLCHFVPFLCHHIISYQFRVFGDEKSFKTSFRIIKQSPAHVPFLCHQMAESDHFDNCSYYQFQDG